MSAAVPEFSRIVTVDRLGTAPHVETLAASPAECAALARRFALAAIDRLTATVALTRHETGGLVMVRGDLTADVVQTCVITGQPVPAAVADGFVAGFVPEDRLDGPLDVEIGPEEDPFDDPEPFDGRAIDVGELVAQYLSLALDPYPRASGAVLETAAIDPAAEGSAGAAAGEGSSPFAVLATLKGRG